MKNFEGASILKKEISWDRIAHALRMLGMRTAGEFVAHAPDFHWNLMLNLKISPKKY
jgi:hypothetical protein